MPSAGSFLRQLSGKEAWTSNSKRWVAGGGNTNNNYSYCAMYEGTLRQMEGLNFNKKNMGRKRVMVLVDESSHAKHAMMFALTHVANKSDLLTLLHVVPLSHKGSSCSPCLANSLGSLCKACRPEVEVEALVIQGQKFETVMSQVKKLEVSVLVLGQKKPSTLLSCFCGKSSTEEFVEQCVYNAECLTIGVRKQSNGLGGYLISTRWQKNFWLLA